MKLYGGVEAGGTKFVCGVGSGNGELVAHEVIATKNPELTLKQICSFFEKNRVSHIGVGSFGPLNLDSDSEEYGKILNTVKSGWSKINIPQYLSEKLGVATTVATDTDTAAIGEQFFGKGVGYTNLVYMTIGTGIGGTAIINNDLMHGISHPEMGHIIIPTDGEKNSNIGSCTYHKDCLENLASGRSIELRYGRKENVIHDQEFVRLEAKRIAYGLVNIISIIQPQRIVLGGSVVKIPNLLTYTHGWVLRLINNYYEIPKINNYIVHTSSDTIGVLGSIKLAESYAKRNN